MARIINPLDKPIWFTSDTHFCHKRIIKFHPGFSSVEERDATLIRNWNDVVGSDDLVFHLGDFALGKTPEISEIQDQLNGEIVLILGNHDNNLRQVHLSRFAAVHNYLELDLKLQNVKLRVVLFHYALRIWNRYNYGSVHLYGHSHGNLGPIGRSMDVGVSSSMTFAPIPWDVAMATCLQHAPKEVDHHKVHGAVPGVFSL